MKVLSWNIRQGGGKRLPAILRAIAARDAATVALSEVSPTRMDELRRGLQELGYRWFSPPTIPLGDRGVLIASKAEFVTNHNCRAEGLSPHRWDAVTFPAASFTLVCSYFPAVADAIQATWPNVLLTCSSIQKQPVLLVGDMNSGQTALDAQSGTLSGDPWFCAMPLHGFVDLWRLKHRSRIEYTWFSQRGGGPMNGFRLDHAFGTKSLQRRVTSCEYSHDERLQGLSDHSVLLVTVR